MPFRRGSSTAFWSAIAGALALLMSWILIAAAWDMRHALATNTTQMGWRLSPRIDWLLWERAVEAFVVTWVFALGASVGSFLNVVVYRMPLGIGLSAGGSRCPRCLTPILARDNVPILGWLALGGRCRACDLPISRRYPLIEALTGLGYVLLFVAIVGLGSQSLPRHQDPVSLGVGEAILGGRWDIILVATIQAITLSFVWAAALMLHDGHRPPRRFWLTGLITTPLLAAGLPLLNRWLTELNKGAAWLAIDYPFVADDPPTDLPSLALWSLVGTTGGLVGGMLVGLVSTAVARLHPLPADDPLPEPETTESDRLEGMPHEAVPVEAEAIEGGTIVSGAVAESSDAEGSAPPPPPVLRTLPIDPPAPRSAPPAEAIWPLPVLIGGGVGYVTLVPIAAWAVALALLGLPLARRWRVSWARIWGFAWTVAALIVLTRWRFWMSWLG
ncbi:MAG TPA: prepilin peptidase [Pirellulaceae bacterium]|nr:prepilin peptidase [Pirellulaceae bacterium]